MYLYALHTVYDCTVRKRLRKQMYLHVHAVRTTDAHRAARRRHIYAARCAQCGAALDESTHVASHVLTYPCAPLNCCVARLALKTCCRACNARHQADHAHACCRASAYFWSWRAGDLLRRCVLFPCCWVYAA